MSFISELQEKAKTIGFSKYYINEWGKDIYFKPITPHETAIVGVRMKNDDAPINYVVELVILKALDESGARIFSNADAEALKALPYQSALAELASAMQARVTVEDAEKN